MLLFTFELILDIIIHMTEVDKYWLYKSNKQMTNLKHFNNIKLISKQKMMINIPKYNFYDHLGNNVLTNKTLFMSTHHDEYKPKKFPSTLVKLSTIASYVPLIVIFPQSVINFKITCYKDTLLSSTLLLDLSNKPPYNPRK